MDGFIQILINILPYKHDDEDRIPFIAILSAITIVRVASTGGVQFKLDTPTEAHHAATYGSGG